MTSYSPLQRTTISVSLNAHAKTVQMQAILTQKLGYRVTQSEAVIRAMDALKREQENGQ